MKMNVLCIRPLGKKQFQNRSRNPKASFVYINPFIDFRGVDVVVSIDTLALPKIAHMQLLLEIKRMNQYFYEWVRCYDHKKTWEIL